MDYIYGNIDAIDFNFKGLTSDSVKVIVDNVARTISAELVKDLESIVSLHFYLDNEKVKFSLEDWMTNEEEIVDKVVTMNINGYPSLCKLNKSITSSGGELSIYLGTGYIRMECNGDPTVSENWTINLDGYFTQVYDDNDFAPYLEISNGEVVRDTVIKPQWVTDFTARADALGYAPARAWVGIDGDWEPCNIYRKFSEDNIVICIQTSKGEYKLNYQYESDPK